MKCKKKIFMGIATLILCFLLLPVNVLADEPSGGDTIVPGNYSLSGETIMYNGLETCLNGNLVYSNDHNTCLGSREAIIAYINSLNGTNTTPVGENQHTADLILSTTEFFHLDNKFPNGYSLFTTNGTEKLAYTTDNFFRISYMGEDQYALSAADVFGSVYGTPEPTINGKTYHWGDAIIQYEGVTLEPVKNKVEEVQHKDAELKPVKNHLEEGHFLVDFHDVSVLDKETKTVLVNVQINTETLEAWGHKLQDNTYYVYDVCVESLNVRKEPSLEGEIIGTLYKYQEMDMLEYHGLGWNKINYKGQEGWVWGEYISEGARQNNLYNTSEEVSVPVVATTYLTTSAKPIDWSIETQENQSKDHVIADQDKVPKDHANATTVD